ncbi:SAM-dependent methyltransferase, partial [Halorubrum sp. SS5]
MEEASSDIEREIYQALDLGDSERDEIHSEVALRTNEDPRDQEKYDPDSITEPGDEFPEQVKDLVLHFALKATSESDDGIIPITDVDGEDDLLTHIEAEFERVWGEYAEARLAEVDEVLGDQNAAEEAYPNLRTWLEVDLFDY